MSEEGCLGSMAEISAGDETPPLDWKLDLAHKVTDPMQ